VKRLSAHHGAATSTQITAVLGSLHDLLVSKDKQIERDARELAVLRHTLLEMDEKLQAQLQTRASFSSQTLATASRSRDKSIPMPPPSPTSPTSPCSCQQPGSSQTPQITITSTSSPSLPSIASKERDAEITDLQVQLAAALAGLEAARLQFKEGKDRVASLEARLAREESRRQVEVGRLETELGMERVKIVGLMEERDLARERLEKIKTTLFAGL